MCPFVMHIINGLAYMLLQLYHNVPLQTPLNNTPECPFARFSWSIFPKLEEFLSRLGSRR